MRPRQPAALFGFTVLVGLARVLAYAGTPIGQDFSVAALAHYAVLHVLAFCVAAVLVAALSRATATRACQIAFYAQAVLFLAPFVDVAVGLPFDKYPNTYVAAPGGTPGAWLAGIAFGAVVAWGVWDATVGPRGARTTSAAVALVLGVVGLTLVEVPWPQSWFVGGISWSTHLALAVYHGAIACVLLDLAVRLANPGAHRRFWRSGEASRLPAFGLLPLIGIATADRLALIPSAVDPVTRVQVEAPYIFAAVAIGALLWAQRNLVRLDAAGPLRLEFAVIVKFVVLAAAFLLGPWALIATVAAASLLWMERDAPIPVVFGLVAGLAVAVGSATAVAVDFVDAVVGPATFTFAVAQGALPTPLGFLAAFVVADLASLAAYLTSRKAA